MPESLKDKTRTEFLKQLALPKEQVKIVKTDKGYEVGTRNTEPFVVYENVEFVELIRGPGDNKARYWLAVKLFGKDLTMLDNVYLNLMDALRDAVLIAAHHDESEDSLIRMDGNQARLKHLNYDHYQECITWMNEPTDLIPIVNNLKQNLTRI